MLHVSPRGNTTLQARIAGLVDALGEALAGVDDEGLVEAWTDGATALVGYAAGEIVGLPATLLVRADERAGLSALITHARSGHPVVRRLAILRRKDGTFADVALTIAGYPAPDGRVSVALGLRDSSAPGTIGAELARRNRDLQEFAAVAAHDLQEPLRKIAAFGDRLASDYGPSLGDGGTDLVRRMQHAAEHMRHLVDGILELSRASGAGAAHQIVDLGGLVNEVAADIESLLDERGGAIEIAPLPSVVGDRAQLKQLFRNLIGNAMKFARPGVPPVVTIDGGLTGAGAARVVVGDNGIGFDAAHLSRIFQPFERLHDRDAYPGSGMGLAICHRVVERHGGTLTATSQPGEGSRFIVELPPVGWDRLL